MCVCGCAHTRAYKERRAQYKQPIANPQPAHCQAQSFMVESEVLSTTALHGSEPPSESLMTLLRCFISLFSPNLKSEKVEQTSRLSPSLHH